MNGVSASQPGLAPGPGPGEEEGGPSSGGGGGSGGGSAAGLLVLASTVAGVARWLGGASDHEHPRCPLRPHGFERWMAVWSGRARQMLLATSSNAI